jgi:hypothetical protein
VYDVSLLSFVTCLSTDNKERQESKHAHKNQETNEKTQQENTNENEHSVTTCKKEQQKQRSRFLQEYKSKTSYTPEDGHVGRKCSVEQRQLNARPSTIKLHADGNLTSKLIEQYNAAGC